MSDAVPLKVSYHSTTIRTRIHENASLKDLKAVVGAAFPVLELEQKEVTHFSYYDEDNTQIDLSSDDDLKEAFKIRKEKDWSALHIQVSESGFICNTRTKESATLATQPVAQALINDIIGTQENLTVSIVTWFIKNMPEAYFREITEEIRKSHIRALISLQMTGQKQQLMLTNQDKTIYTYFNSNNYIGLLSEVVESLPKEKLLREANIYTSLDNQLVLDVFDFGVGKKFTVDTPEEKKRFDEINQQFVAKKESQHIPNEEIGNLSKNLLSHLIRCDHPYVMNTDAPTILVQFELVESLGDGVLVYMQPPTATENACFTVVVKPVEYNDVLERISRHVAGLNVDIIKSKMTRIANLDSEHDTLIMTCYTRNDFTKDTSFAKRLESELARLNWVDDSVLSYIQSTEDVGLAKSEVIMGISQLVHSVLSEAQPYVYTLHNLKKFLSDHPTLVEILFLFFEEKFAPCNNSKYKNNDERIHACTKMFNSLMEEIDHNVEFEDCRNFYHHCAKAVYYGLKTNFYLQTRRGFSMRLDPAYFERMCNNGEIPFGVFYVFGRNYQGFHVRFRDIARGGIRIVIPASREQHLIANRGLFRECYGLASAQQLKNKDIPEGGSKGVILLWPGKKPAGAFKSFTDSLLDLIILSSSSLQRTMSGREGNISYTKQSSFVDYYGKDEYLYLGPDENVTNELITWICKRAVQRKHQFPSTFMSSKPGAGINHKQYGVTSEGVTVFLDVALQRLGFKPREKKFTVKITGGPDGDVAGNEIKILAREYGENAQIVAVADGFGLAEDPNGLNQTELLRLVEESLSIVHFNPSKLSEKGVVFDVKNHEGLKARNSMHFRVKTDVFIPAGGRPFAVNDNNWSQFLDCNGVPCSKLIVEGANIFFSPGAREKLSNAGVTIIKDSSANKCGVICSSFEILAGIIVSEETFLNVKEEYVKQVLERLRFLAKQEGELLFREYQTHCSRSASQNLNLPEISIQISKAITFASDAVEAYVRRNPAILKSELAKSVLEFYVPKVLQEKGDVAGSLPVSYKNWLIASAVASTMVYNEGLNFLENLINLKGRDNLEGIGKVIASYWDHRDRVKEWIRVLEHPEEKVDQKTRDALLTILKKGGIQIALLSDEGLQ